VNVTLGGLSDSRKYFGPTEEGGPVSPPTPTTYFYTWIIVKYDVDGAPHTKRLTFENDFPSDTPGDDSASGWF
jgi:hypothetical protein